MAEIRTQDPEALEKVSAHVPAAVSEQVSPAVSEQGPPVKDGSVIDNEAVQKLTAENEKLKVFQVYFKYILEKDTFHN